VTRHRKCRSNRETIEPSTVAGQRLRVTVLSALHAHGIRYAMINGYANAYASYTVTPEEYAHQGYEGACTLFGQWTLGAFQTAVMLPIGPAFPHDEWAREVVQGRPAPDGSKHSVVPRSCYSHGVSTRTEYVDLPFRRSCRVTRLYVILMRCRTHRRTCTPRGTHC
jgi:hypothetical protein